MSSYHFDFLEISVILIYETIAGGSSGAVMHAACQMAKTLSPDQRCVVILPDGIRNYMTKFVDDEWLEAKGLLSTGNLKH